MVVDLDRDGDFSSSGYRGPDRKTTYIIGQAQMGNRQQSQLSLVVGMGVAPSVDVGVTFVDGTVVTRADVPSGASVVIADR